MHVYNYTPLQPEPWSEFLSIWLCYVLILGFMDYFAVFLWGCLVMSVVSAIKKTSSKVVAYAEVSLG